MIRLINWKNYIFIYIHSYTYDLTNTLQHNLADIEDTNEKSSKYFGFRNKPCTKFQWNEFFLKKISKKLSYQWMTYLIHGYLAQSSLNIFGCNLLITLISR